MQISNFQSKQKILKSVEIVPKRNENIDDLLEAREIFSDIADMVTAPENQMGRPGIDPLMALYIMTHGTNMIAMPHVTPRDKNTLYISSQVLTSGKLRINHFFVIGGDPISGNFGREVREMDTNETIRHIRKFSREQERDKEAIIGAALNPYRNSEEEIVRSKIESGATLFISQMCYNSEPLKKKWIRQRKFKLFLGFMPILKKSNIESLSKMGVLLPEGLKSIIANSENLRDTSLKLIDNLVSDMKGYIDGVHIMPIGNNEIAKEIMEVL